MRSIVITGPDGSGKSTLIKQLIKTYPVSKELSIWDAMDVNLFPKKSVIDTYLCSLHTDSRALFLAHAMAQSLHKVKDDSDDLFFINAHFFKYLASELAHGLSVSKAKILQQFFDPPKYVIYLDISPEQAAERKERFTRYECGLKSARKANFIDFQTKCQSQFLTLRKKNWKIVEASLPAEDVLQHVISIIDEYEI